MKTPEEIFYNMNSWTREDMIETIKCVQIDAYQAGHTQAEQDISSQLIACKEALGETTKELEQVFTDWYPYDDETEIHRIGSIVDKAKTLI